MVLFSYAGLSGIAICSSDQKFSLFLCTLELAHELEACLIRAITVTNLKEDSFSDINSRKQYLYIENHLITNIQIFENKRR